jgi:hypothetical protein
MKAWVISVSSFRSLFQANRLLQVFGMSGPDRRNSRDPDDCWIFAHRGDPWLSLAALRFPETAGREILASCAC